MQVAKSSVWRYLDYYSKTHLSCFSMRQYALLSDLYLSWESMLTTIDVGT